MFQQYLVYIMIGLVVLGIAFASLKSRWSSGVFQKGKDKSNEKDKEKRKEVIEQPVYARIKDNLSRTSYNTTLTGDIVKKIKEKYGSLGGQWNFNGKWLYEFCRHDKEDYEPYDNFLSPDREHPPSALHRYIDQPEIAISRNVQIEKNLMERYSWLLPWTIGIGFLIFMLVSGRG